MTRRGRRREMLNKKLKNQFDKKLKMCYYKNIKF
nr:MAG TPA: hypothetical protein [Siphoviridae sp. ctELO16]